MKQIKRTFILVKTLNVALREATRSQAHTLSELQR